MESRAPPKQNFWSSELVGCLEFIGRKKFEEERFTVVDNVGIIGQ